MEQPINHLDMRLQVDDVSEQYLKEIAKWGKFLSVVGFVISGLIALLSIFAGTIFSSFSGSSALGAAASTSISIILTVVYIVLAVLYFFPCLFLFKFSNKAKLALEIEDQFTLNEAFASLKSCFKFVGVSTIVILALYALTFVGGAVMGALSR